MFLQNLLDRFSLVRVSDGNGVSSTSVPLQLGAPQPMKLPMSLPSIYQGPPVLIPQLHKPLWFEKGWRRARDGKEYKGHFFAAGRTWRGLILEPYPRGFTAYIWHPPKSDIHRNTSHGPCFSPNGETGRHEILFHSTPTSLDHVITSIEEVLAQALSARP